MDSIGYTTLTRQSGLMREMNAVAHNIANMSTTGYRREGLMFAEHVAALEPAEASLSMATATVRTTDETQGALTATGGSFDLAIEGDGYFLVLTPRGEALTRAGNFTPNDAGELVTADGYQVLDGGGAPIFIPPDARSVSVSEDGTVGADGNPVAQIALYMPVDPLKVTRDGGTLFVSEGGVEPMEDARIMQGFIEGSNVDPVSEITRMIEVQRAYELGQKFLDREDERIRSVIQAMVKS